MPHSALVMLVFSLFHGEYVAGDAVLDQLTPQHKDGGSWMVEEGCLAVQMEAQIKFSSNNSNVFLTSTIPASAIVSPTSFCSEVNTSTSQGITIEWMDTDTLTRNFTLVFAINKTSIPPSYGISMLSSTYQVAQGNNSNFSEMIEKNLVGKFVKMSTNAMTPIQFMVPQNRSFMCDEPQMVEMSAELLTADGSLVQQLPKAVLTLKTIQFDAFRPVSSLPEFQPSTSCTHQHSSDLVPIVVGGGLAVVVLLIIVSYIVGRRRGGKVKGYDSV